MKVFWLWNTKRKGIFRNFFFLHSELMAMTVTTRHVIVFKHMKDKFYLDTKMAWKCRSPGGSSVSHSWDLASLLVVLPSEHGCSSEAIAVNFIFFSHGTPSLLDMHACMMVPWQLSVTFFFHLCLAISPPPWSFHQTFSFSLFPPELCHRRRASRLF